MCGQKERKEEGDRVVIRGSHTKLMEGDGRGQKTVLIIYNYPERNERWIQQQMAKKNNSKLD